MQVGERVQIEHVVRQTYGGITAATAALLSLFCPPSSRADFDRLVIPLPGQLERSFSGHPRTNSSAWIETTSNVDQSLMQGFSRAFVHLVQHQVDLDADAKRALYSNLRRLYRR